MHQVSLTLVIIYSIVMITPSTYLYLGNVYIADAGNNRIRKLTVSTSIITTFAGTGASSYSGDNGAATSAALYFPVGVAVDTSGIPHFYSHFPP